MLRDRTAGAGPSLVMAIGRRLHSHLKEVGYPAADSVRPPGSVDAVDRAVIDVLAIVDEWREQGRADRLYLTYNRPTRGASYDPYTVQLLPFDNAWLDRLRRREWP